MTLLQNIRESSDFERKFNLRKEQVGDLDSITPETLDLQIFVLKYDRDRYLRKNIDRWINIAHLLEGIAILYQRIIDEGVEKWSEEDFLREQWAEGVMAKGSYATLGDKENMMLSIGVQNGIAGLLEGQLVYDLKGKSPKNNLKYVRAVKKWEAFEQENMRSIIGRQMDKRYKIDKETPQK